MLVVPWSDRVTAPSFLPPGVEVGDDRLAEAVIVEGGAEGTPGSRLHERYPAFSLVQLLHCCALIGRDLP